MLGLHPLSYAFDDYFYPASYLHPVLDATGTEPYGIFLQIRHKCRMSTISICRSMHWLLAVLARTRRQPWSMSERLYSSKYRYRNRRHNILLLSLVSLHPSRDHVFLTSVQVKPRITLWIPKKKKKGCARASVASHQVPGYSSTRPPSSIGPPKISLQRRLETDIMQRREQAK
jgi:hypothetical protein